MASLQKFCDRMRYWCSDEANLGYDQSNRWDVNVGGETDCSALVITALREAGFDTGTAGYTGNLSSNLTARGWSRIPFTWSPKAGDILLNDAMHVAVWLGDCVAQASGDENGGIKGGASGDQTGYETALCGLYNYPWDCILRYEGTTDEGDDDDMPTVQEIMEYPISDPDGNTYPFWQHISWGRYYAMNAAKDVWNAPITDTFGGDDIPAWQLLTWSRTYDLENYERLAKMDAQVSALSEAVKALATMQGADPDAVVKAVGDAVDRKLATIKIDVTTQ